MIMSSPGLRQIVPDHLGGPQVIPCKRESGGTVSEKEIGPREQRSEWCDPKSQKAGSGQKTFLLNLLGEMPASLPAARFCPFNTCLRLTTSRIVKKIHLCESTQCVIICGSSHEKWIQWANHLHTHASSLLHHETTFGRSTLCPDAHGHRKGPQQGRV